MKLFASKKNIILAFMAILFIFGLSNVLASFSDVPSNYVYIDAVNYAESNNIVNGYSDGTFKPYTNITRGQLAKIIIEYKYSDDDINACSSNAFSDVDTNNKFKKYICLAKSRGVVGGYSDGTYRSDNNITTAEAIKIISNALGYTSGEDPDRTQLFKYYIDALAAKSALPDSLVNKDTNINRGEVVEIIYRLANGITNKASKNWSDLSESTTACSSEYELENANKISGFSIITDSSASNSEAVQASGTKNTTTPSSTEVIEICLYSASTANIEISAKASSGSTDSVWIISGSNYENVDLDENNQYKWYTPSQVKLSAGNNTIKLATREPGAVIDKVRVQGGSTTPTLTPTPTGSLTPTPTGSLTPTLTPTPNPNAGYPYQLLRNYKQWKITLPDGSTKFDLKDLSNEYFYVNNSKNAIVFKAPIRSNNGTTPNSSYIRSELREMLPDGSNEIYWTTSGKHVLYVKQAITHLPTVKKHLVASQIHGNKSDGIDDSMVLRLENSHLFLSFNGGKLRSDVTVKSNYSLGTIHEVIFEVDNDKHIAYYSEDGNLLNAYNSGNADGYAVKENGNKVLMTKSYGEAYFKAGNYTQSNKDKEGSETDKADNYGEVVLYDVWVSHQ